MDAFPKVTLLSGIVGLLEKGLGEFLWPTPGETSNVIVVVVPSSPAVNGLSGGAGLGTRAVLSSVQGFKTWFCSSMQPNWVLLRVPHDELPRHKQGSKSWGWGRAHHGQQKFPRRGRGSGDISLPSRLACPSDEPPDPQSPPAARPRYPAPRSPQPSAPAGPCPPAACTVRQHCLRMAGFFLCGRVVHPLLAALSSLSLSHRVICSMRSD